ncbi:hypothetical protein BDF20DRAFT_987609 [Mycotypha africana]|uniref:uncharacterized protein n=1 Tax=Mycotypha africana TaxID=64632 RepID=UPI0022FFE4FF|nr:uncharacterized protein BDF20DRAFT_987609 [Mycotypha africana]KAI8979326.1 hypothetical protein BDF20DRAFT_987609 [Mycotypha africana]
MQAATINNQQVVYSSWDYICTINNDRQEAEFVYPDSVTSELATRIMDLSETQQTNDTKYLTCSINSSPVLVTLTNVMSSNDSNIKVTFCYVVGNNTLPVHFKRAPTGHIIKAAISEAPFNMVYKDRYGTSQVKQTLALVICTNIAEQLALLTFDNANSCLTAQRVEQLRNNSIPSSAVVSTVHMLEANKEANRKSHSDPRILLGFTSGHLLMYRVRTQVYTYNAPRVRDPVDLSEFVEFKNRKVFESLSNTSLIITNYCNTIIFFFDFFLTEPVDHIACTRTSNNFKVFVTISQNGGNEMENNANHDDRKSYVRLVEVYADNLKKNLGLISPNAYGSATDPLIDQIVAIDFALVRKISSMDRTHLFLLIINSSHYFLDIWTAGFDNSTKFSLLRQVSRLSIPKKTCYEMVLKTLKKDNNGNSSSLFMFDMKGFLQTNGSSVIYDTIIQYYISHAHQSLMKHHQAHHDNVEAENKRIASAPLESHRPLKRQRRHSSDSTHESVVEEHVSAVCTNSDKIERKRAAPTSFENICTVKRQKRYSSSSSVDNSPPPQLSPPPSALYLNSDENVASAQLQQQHLQVSAELQGDVDNKEEEMHDCQDDDCNTVDSAAYLSADEGIFAQLQQQHLQASTELQDDVDNNEEEMLDSQVDDCTSEYSDGDESVYYDADDKFSNDDNEPVISNVFDAIHNDQDVPNEPYTVLGDESLTNGIESCGQMLLQYSGGPEKARDLTSSEIKGFGQYCWDQPSIKFRFYLLLLLMDRQVEDELKTEIVYIVRSILLSREVDTLSAVQKNYCLNLYRRYMKEVHPTVAYRVMKAVEWPEEHHSRFICQAWLLPTVNLGITVEIVALILFGFVEDNVADSWLVGVVFCWHMTYYRYPLRFL